MANTGKHLYGPVPSRRLGLSLGVDIVPFKTCTLDCIYCQLGKTTSKTLERKEYVPVSDILVELQDVLDAGLAADYITIGGSGEPTLHSGIGRLIVGIKKITSIPVAVLTNSTLFYLPEVRKDCAAADVILPSLDAGDQQTYEAINRPVKQLTFDMLVEGLCALKRDYPGQIWLEVFFVDKLNTDDAQIAKISEAIKKIRPDKVHLNTAVRPTAEKNVEKVAPDKLREIARRLSPNCEVIADFVSGHCRKTASDVPQTLLSMLKRRPCSLNDICSVLGLDAADALVYLDELKNQRVIWSENKQGKIFFGAF
ncbi:MAG: radical SAM protein [Sedimentisphaerales bacterium]|jgi:wyosine [tRNA(Phe)-imidazoG37] synthetase (radical SAM superfamily)